MADLWEEILADAQLGDITFPVKARSFEIGRDLARIVLPHQPGQRVSDTGRKALVFKLQVELWADVDSSHYPDTYQDLIDLVADDDTKGEVEYTDPFLGVFNVKIVGLSCSEDAEARNGASVEIVLEEVTDDDAMTFLVPPRSPGREVIEAAAELDDSLADLGVDDVTIEAAFAASGFPKTGDEASWESGQTFSELAADFSDLMVAGTLAVDVATAAIDASRARISGVTELSELRTATGWTAYSSALRLIESMSQLADRTVAQAAPIVDFVVAGELSAYDIAARVYGDPGRADEIMRRNPSRVPWAYPAGTVLRIASR